MCGCDTRGLTLRPIEIIVSRKVAPAFEPRNWDGWTARAADDDREVRETGPPDRKCRILFSELQPDRRKLDERKEVGRDLL